jgi:tetratricopeptide (TPR) repeat protein
MKRRTTAVPVLATIALGVALSSPARAESLSSLFEGANGAFWNGDFAKAAELYEEIEGLGTRSASLSYNRATAEARLGNLGRAIQHYERALRTDPGHADTLHNLALIREFIAKRASEAGRDADLAPAVGPWRAVLDRFSLRSAALAFLVFHLALFTVLVARRFVRAEGLHLALGVTAGILLLLALATGAVTLGKYDQDVGEAHEAVVVERGTLPVMEGPASSARRFTIEEGSRVSLLERRDEWTRIRDDQGRDGWVPATALGTI